MEILKIRGVMSALFTIMMAIAAGSVALQIAEKASSTFGLTADAVAPKK